MKNSDNEKGVSMEMPPEDALVAFWMTWLALGEALKMLGEKHGNSGWREELYERVQQSFDSIETTAEGDQAIVAKTGVNSNDRAFQIGSKAVSAAFDRIKFN